MSSIPGYTLEKLLLWDFNLVLATTEGEVNPNVSMSMAFALGTVEDRFKRITPEQLKQMTDLIEESRESLENFLSDFDEDTQSWRDYGSYWMDYLEPGKKEELQKLVGTF